MDEAWAFFTSSGMVASYVVVAVTGVILGVLHRIRTVNLQRREANGDADPRRARTLSGLFVTLRYVILALAVLLILQLNGVNVSSMVTALGVAGIVVGFALQDSLADVIMGIHILVDGFFRVGDVIRFNEYEGEVIMVTPQTTKIRLLSDNSTLAVSNRNISQVTLVSKGNMFDVAVPYETSQEDAKRLMNCMVDRMLQVPGVDACEYRGIQDLADSAVMHRLYFECDPKLHYAVRRALNGAALQVYEEWGVDVPYNRLELMWGQSGESE